MAGRPRKCPRDGVGGESRDVPVQFHIDWTECPRDRRDISTEQTGHVHGMVVVQKWGCPAELCYVNLLFFFFLFPSLESF